MKLKTTAWSFAADPMDQGVTPSGAVKVDFPAARGLASSIQGKMTSSGAPPSRSGRRRGRGLDVLLCNFASLLGLSPPPAILLIDAMAISSNTAMVFMLLLSATFFMQLPVQAHARKLQVQAPIIAMHPPCTGRSTLEAHAEQTESTTPGHSPSIGHNSPPDA